MTEMESRGKFAARVGSVVATLSLLAGGLAAAPPVTAQTVPTFYVIAHVGPSDPFWAIEQKGAQAAGRDLHVRVIFEGPSKFNVGKELDMFDAAVAAHPNGIAVTIAAPHVFDAPVAHARALGIPVISYNAQDFGGHVPVIGYVGQDETKSGARLAEHLLPFLKKGDHVVVANHQPGLFVLELRYEGIKHFLAAHGITTSELNVGSDPSVGETILASYFKAHPNTQAIVTLGPLGTAAAGEFLTQHHLAGTVKLASFDLDPVTLHYIENGTDLFTLDQQPFEQAYLAVTLLYLKSKYGMTPPVVNTGTVFLSKKNVAPFVKLVHEGIGG